jgi:hypothetical protein
MLFSRLSRNPKSKLQNKSTILRFTIFNTGIVEEFSKARIIFSKFFRAKNSLDKIIIEI